MLQCRFSQQKWAHYTFAMYQSLAEVDLFNSWPGWVNKCYMKRYQWDIEGIASYDLEEIVQLCTSCLECSMYALCVYWLYVGQGNNQMCCLVVFVDVWPWQPVG